MKQEQERKEVKEGKEYKKRGRKIWSTAVTVRNRQRESDVSEGVREKFREILLIKKRSTTRGDDINQSSALMRHLRITLK